MRSLYLITSPLFDAVALIFFSIVAPLCVPASPFGHLAWLKTTDLAVIFRPAVLSHPDHEMQPQEHRLSQEVLEFLIAHQDWFMLDIPPPPTTSAGLVGSDEEADVVLTSDEEGNGGGWKLVDNAQSPRIGRRRTMTEKHGGTSLHLSLRRFSFSNRRTTHFSTL